MKPYRVEGHFRMGRVETPFTVETVAKDEADARERVLSTIGSRHGVNRRLVHVTKVTALAPDQVTDAVVQHRLAKKA